MNGIVARELRIAELEAQLGLLLRENAELLRESVELRATLQEAFRRGHHPSECAYIRNADMPCSCWLSRAKELMEAK